MIHAETKEFDAIIREILGEVRGKVDAAGICPTCFLANAASWTMYNYAIGSMADEKGIPEGGNISYTEEEVAAVITQFAAETAARAIESMCADEHACADPEAALH